jgi:hypothetical protein
VSKVCEGCGAALVHKSDDGRELTHEVGVVLKEVYDGVLFWMCPFCSHVRHRWEEGSILRRRAEKHAPVFRDCGMSPS